MPEPPTPRRGDALPDDHPLQAYGRGDVEPYPYAGDCISDVPAEVLEAVAAYHDNAEPPTTDVDPGELS